MSDVNVQVAHDASLLQVMEQMHSRKHTYALVTGAGVDRLGLITMTDMVRIVHLKGKLGDWLNDETAGQHMTTDLITVKIDEPCQEILRLFLETRVHQLVVIDGQEPAGIITLLDLTTWFFGA